MNLKQFSTLSRVTTPLSVAAIAAVLTMFSAGSAKAQYYWQGHVSSDPTDSANWYQGNAPTYPSNNPMVELILQSSDSNSGHGINYTAAQGTSTFGYFYDGDQYAGSTNGDTVSGGTLNLGGPQSAGGENGGGFTNLIGYNYAGSLSVTGGTVNFLGSNGFSGNSSLWIGFQNSGTLSLSGGLVTTQNNLTFDWNGGSGLLNISGGTFNVEGTGGTTVNNTGAGGTGTIDFQAGNGVFEQTASANFAAAMKVKFDYQTGDMFKVAAADASTFSALAAAGNLSYQTSVGGTYLTLDNVATDSNYYLNYLSATQSAGVETLNVIAPLAAPEPSTWASLLGGLLVLGFVARRRAMN
jgi:hypothetical protein